LNLTQWNTSQKAARSREANPFHPIPSNASI
jgi:hypothetical protein